MISLRLPMELEQELTTISRIEATTKTQIVRQAIVEYLARLKEKRTKTAYTLGEDLFGVYEGDTDLSSDYKHRLDDLLHEKYPS